MVLAFLQSLTDILAQVLITDPSEKSKQFHFHVKTKEKITKRIKTVNLEGLVTK